MHKTPLALAHAQRFMLSLCSAHEVLLVHTALRKLSFIIIIIIKGVHTVSLTLVQHMNWERGLAGIEKKRMATLVRYHGSMC
jgi:hypothetical protein